jgi:hypothetical protein
VKVLVGTLVTIENELSDCIAKVAAQTGITVEHFFIRDLADVDAHWTMYKTFMERAAHFDFFVKVDADMVIALYTFRCPRRARGRTVYIQ